MKVVAIIIWLLAHACPKALRLQYFIHARCLVQWFRVGRYEL